jgi:hypothetical protein
VTSAFLSNMHDALALTGTGVFGLVMSGGLGALFWRAQRGDLAFRAIPTGADAATNFPAVRAAAIGAGWTIRGEEPGASLTAQTADTAFSAGERVAVRFRGREVLVACIADPGVGFSMVGRRRCEAHRELVRASVGERATR